ncbi:MAG: FtsX-like permease family protein [Betaproteobacteria bacterium]|nr:MAG: FtsX-like permease family protein [Betaproteobacteria bacterium]
MALGASRQRLARQLLIESVLLAVAGGTLGLVIATWGAGALLAYVPNPGITLTVAATPDGRIVAFTTIVAILTGVAFGLAPSLRSTRPDVAPTLRAEGGTAAGGAYGRLRRGFMVAQVALSVLLLVGAGLFVRSLSNLMRTNLGIETNRTLSFRIDPDTNGYAGERDVYQAPSRATGECSWRLECCVRHPAAADRQRVEQLHHYRGSTIRS